MFFSQKKIIILGKSLSRKIPIFNVIFNLLLQKCSFYLSFGQSYFINLNPASCANTVNESACKSLKGLSMKQFYCKVRHWVLFAQALPHLLTVVLAVPSVQMLPVRSEDIILQLSPLK